MKFIITHLRARVFFSPTRWLRVLFWRALEARTLQRHLTRARTDTHSDEVQHNACLYIAANNKQPTDGSISVLLILILKYPNNPWSFEILFLGRDPTYMVTILTNECVMSEIIFIFLTIMAHGELIFIVHNYSSYH